MPLSVPTGNGGDASDAFFHQFSTIISTESRLQGDNSEDATGPARRHWATRHLAKVAQAQGFTSQQLPTTQEAAALNVHAREFVIPPPHAARKATYNRAGYNNTPWYENFNLADQGVRNSSGPYRPPAVNRRTSRPPNSYRPFDPAELEAYRAKVEAQLFPHGNTQRVVSAPDEAYHHYDYNYDDNNADPSTFPHDAQPHPEPGPQLPSTPPPRVRYPSTPPNRPARGHRHTLSAESFADLVGSTRANTEPIAESARMSSLAAPEHYEPVEVCAREVREGDFIQSVRNPGMCGFLSCLVLFIYSFPSFYLMLSPFTLIPLPPPL